MWWPLVISTSLDMTILRKNACFMMIAGCGISSVSALFVCFVALRPKSTAMVMVGGSVSLTTFLPGQAGTSSKPELCAHTFACNWQQSKKESKDQESIQSSTIPGPGYQWESDNHSWMIQRKGGEWPEKLFHDQSPRKYGTGPRSNSRPLDLQSD